MILNNISLYFKWCERNMWTYEIFHCLFSLHLQACRRTEVLFGDQQHMQYDKFFLYLALLSISCGCKVMLVQEKNNLECPTSHLANGLNVTQTTGFSCIAGNLFPITSSSAIRQPPKKVVCQEDKAEGFMRADRTSLCNGKVVVKTWGVEGELYQNRENTVQVSMSACFSKELT